LAVHIHFERSVRKEVEARLAVRYEQVLPLHIAGGGWCHEKGEQGKDTGHVFNVLITDSFGTINFKVGESELDTGKVYKKKRNGKNVQETG
jgi:hypothetical protein